MRQNLIYPQTPFFLHILLRAAVWQEPGSLSQLPLLLRISMCHHSSQWDVRGSLRCSLIHFLFSMPVLATVGSWHDKHKDKNENGRAKPFAGSQLHPCTAGCLPVGFWLMRTYKPLFVYHCMLGFYKLWPNVFLSGTVFWMPFITAISVLYNWTCCPPAYHQPASTWLKPKLSHVGDIKSGL